MTIAARRTLAATAALALGAGLAALSAVRAHGEGGVEIVVSAPPLRVGPGDLRIAQTAKVFTVGAS